MPSRARVMRAFHVHSMNARAPHSSTVQIGPTWLHVALSRFFLGANTLTVDMDSAIMPQNPEENHDFWRGIEKSLIFGRILVASTR
mgnify:CR=1 FL=1